MPLLDSEGRPIMPGREELFRGIAEQAIRMGEKAIRPVAIVPLEDLLSANPCWCGRPSEELADNDTGRTRGYCYLHCELTQVTRHRVVG